MITIVDYGAGNLANVKNALDFLGIASEISADAESVHAAEKVILPGVGAFQPAMERLKERGLADAIAEKAANGTPLLGICLGMHLLMAESFENGRHAGLGLIPGQVRRFGEGVKIPQIGWNSIFPAKPSRLLNGVPDGSYAYFVHGYHCVPDDPADELAWSEYGGRFTAMIEKDDVFGAQFHPEKSQKTGLTILKNFGEL